MQAQREKSDQTMVKPKKAEIHDLTGLVQPKDHPYNRIEKNRPNRQVFE